MYKKGHRRCFLAESIPGHRIATLLFDYSLDNILERIHDIGQPSDTRKKKRLVVYLYGIHWACDSTKNVKVLTPLAQLEHGQIAEDFYA